MDNSIIIATMIILKDEKRIQTPEAGNILEWEGNYSYEVALGDGMPEWNEILDTGQLEPIEPEIVE